MVNESSSAATGIAVVDLEKLQSQVAAINEELSGRHELSVRVEVDATSLLRGKDEAANAALVQKVVNEALRNFVYAVTEAHRELPLEGRVKVIRLEGVDGARQRVVFAEGPRIIYRLSVREAEGFYNAQDLVRLLVGVTAGMEESAPPGEMDSKPSYQPAGDPGKIVRDYQEFVVPVLMGRTAAMIGNRPGLEVDWQQFAASEGQAAALWTWGLNRLCGAIGLLAGKEENRSLLKGAVEVLRILPVPQAAMKAMELHEQELWMSFSPGDGETGGFYEGEIAEWISKKLKLRIRPKIAELQRYAERWEKSLTELLRAPGPDHDPDADITIQYGFDWEGFTSNADENKNLFALTQLREMGIDWMYYALAGLMEKNPNFKQQLPRRVRRIYLEHAASADKKGVRGEQATLVLKIFLHEGYNGYLTIKDLEKALPGVVAGMPDIVEEPIKNGPGEGPKLMGMEAERVAAEAMAALKAEVGERLVQLAAWMDGIIGKELPVEVAWETFSGNAAAIREFLNPTLDTLFAVLATAGEDQQIQSAAASMIDKVVVRQGDGTDDHDHNGFTLASRILTYTAIHHFGTGKPLETPEAIRLMRQALGVPVVQEEEESETEKPLVELRMGALVPDPAVEEFAIGLKKQFEGMLPVYAQQFAMILGKPVDFEIEWASVRGGMEAMGQLLNAGLTPTVGGLAIFASDPKKKLLAHKLVSRVVLRQAAATSEHGFSLKDSTLTYSAALMAGVPPMDPHLAAALLETVLKSGNGVKRIKAKPRGKAAPKKKPKKRSK